MSTEHFPKDGDNKSVILLRYHSRNVNYKQALTRQAQFRTYTLARTRYRKARGVQPVVEYFATGVVVPVHAPCIPHCSMRYCKNIRCVAVNEARCQSPLNTAARAIPSAIIGITKMCDPNRRPYMRRDHQKPTR